MEIEEWKQKINNGNRRMEIEDKDIKQKKLLFFFL